MCAADLTLHDDFNGFGQLAQSGQTRRLKQETFLAQA
jgi:hypothetical protein